MIPDAVQQYCAQLADLGIAHDVLEHPELEEIKAVLDYLHLGFADSLPTLVMKADDDFIALVFRGDSKVDFKKVKRTFGIKDLRLATPDEFRAVTGLSVGAARVYLPATARTVIDDQVMLKDYLVGGSGSFSCSITYKTADLLNIPNSVMLDITR